MAANGYIPSSWLKSLPGSNAGLIKGYAYAYWAWHYASVKRGYGSLAIYDGSVGRTYRSYSRQLAAKRIYGSNAATPGYSNHGLGRAVDLMSQGQRSSSDRIGRTYGWHKSTSDAAWEWWHLRGIRTMGSTGGGGGESYAARQRRLLKHLGPKKERPASEKLLYHRRMRAAEARTGKGPKWKAHNKWCKYWWKQVDYWMRREAKTGKGARYRTLKMVRDDRNGRI